LLSTVDAMAPRTVRTADRVVQLIGGVGNAAVQVKATRLADRLARVTGAQPLYLPAPGIVATETARVALLQDPFIADVAAAWTGLTVAVVGIGSLQPSPLLADSGNTVAESDMSLLRAAGAVGDVCLRFFDEDGTIVDTGLDERVLGISTEELRAVPRRIGIAGGERKFAAIRAAVRGGWVNVLITDAATAQKLVD